MWIQRDNLWRILSGVLRWWIWSWIFDCWVICYVLYGGVFCSVLNCRIISKIWLRRIFRNIWRCRIICDIWHCRIIGDICYCRIRWIIYRIIINDRNTIINRNQKTFLRFFNQYSRSIISNRLNIRLINNFKPNFTSWTDYVFIR